MKFGTLTKEDLRKVWKKEDKDFTPWLAQQENLSALGKTVGIDLELVEKEAHIGSFNADIVAMDTTTERKVVIENQLEDTDHDHLGKLITYAAGTDAEAVIWIVKNAREEHCNAIEWLNNHTDDTIGFFLIEMEVWRIGSSDLAPHFNLIEQPNTWVRAIKTNTPAKSMHYNYWTAFNNYAPGNTAFTKEFNLRKASTDHWYSIAIGMSGCYIDFIMHSTRGKVEIELYISDDKALYKKFEAHKAEIEKIIGTALDWREMPTKKSSRILLALENLDFNDTASWNKQFDWLMNYAILYKKAFVRFAK